MNKYEKFWEWFKTLEKEFLVNIEEKMEDYVPLISEKLYEINENLAFEISELLENNTRQFIISADGIYSAFNDVKTVLEYAPKLSKWEIIPFRQREEVTFHSVELDGLYYSYSDIYFTYEVSNDLISIDVYLKDYDGEDNRYIHAYFLLLDSLIGEYDAVTLFKETNVYPLESCDELYDFYDLLSIVNKLK